MIEPLLVSSSLLIGKEMFTQTITTTTKNIYNGIDKILLNDNVQFKKILDDLDITIKLDIIHTFILELHNDTKLFNETVTKTFNYLEEILKIIEQEIENINNEIIKHNEKWFSRFRFSNCPNMLVKLINHIKILDNRFELLIKLIKI
tara:strand:- start:79 stop:519 length:441 start_codon:yes stop_codon:yes gene_type:complete